MDKTKIKKIILPSVLIVAGGGLLFIFRKKIAKIIDPVDGIITQYFSVAHPAIDIAIPVGTEIQSPADGIVKSVYYNELGGNQIIIEHPKFALKTGYAHLSSTLVTAGQTVKRGDLIAKSGNTGYSTGPHLHFVVKKNDIPVNPLTIFKLTV